MADQEISDFVGSHMKPENKYGQNGYQGASSDLPGKHTTSGFLPAVTVPASDWQTRKVSAEPFPPSFGMKSPNSKSDFPTENVRRAVERGSKAGSFQR